MPLGSDVHYLDLAFGETVRFDDDMAALNTLPRGPNRAQPVRSATSAA